MVFPFFFPSPQGSSSQVCIRPLVHRRQMACTLSLLLSCLCFSIFMYLYLVSLSFLFGYMYSASEVQAEIPGAWHDGWSRALALSHSVTHANILPSAAGLPGTCSLLRHCSKRRDTGKMHVLFSLFQPASDLLWFTFLPLPWPAMAARPHGIAGGSEVWGFRRNTWWVSRLSLPQCVPARTLRHIFRMR